MAGDRENHLWSGSPASAQKTHTCLCWTWTQLCVPNTILHQKLLLSSFNPHFFCLTRKNAGVKEALDCPFSQGHFPSANCSNSHVTPVCSPSESSIRSAPRFRAKKNAQVTPSSQTDNLRWDYTVPCEANRVGFAHPELPSPLDSMSFNMVTH